MVCSLFLLLLVFLFLLSLFNCFVSFSSVLFSSLLSNRIESNLFSFVSLEIQTLLGHDQAITCLAHPHSEYTRYEIQHLLSASLDYSIRLWDLASGHQLHAFTIHSGPVLMFHIPPPMLNVRFHRMR